MAESLPQHPSPAQARVIEFDMFVDDLEPEESEEVRGGSSKRQTRAPIPDNSEKSN